MMNKQKIDISFIFFLLLLLLTITIGAYYSYLDTSNKIMLHEYLKNNGGK